jgi:hypothetical protein
LLGGAVGIGGVMQGLHWRSTGSRGDLEVLENQLRMVVEENEILQRENESLRSLVQGGGEFPVPQELIDRVEKDFGVTFISSPVVHRVAGEELRGRISAAYESRFGPAGIDYREEAYAMIGWIRPEDKLLAQLTAVRSVGARSWFDDVTGEGWVTDRFSMEEIPDQAALVRVLSRILLHQHFPPPPGYPGDDAARAREALHQGAASGAETRYYSANAREIGFLPMREEGEAEQLLMALPSFIQGLTTFPVLEGRGLADTLHVQGDEKLLAALRHPPQTTRQIYFPGEPVPELKVLEMPTVPGESFLSESAGQLGLRLWLEPLGDVGAAAEIAAEWRNDRYLLFPEGESDSGLVWDIELQDAGVAEQLQSISLDLIAAMAAREDPAALGEVVATPEGRHLRVTRVAPTRLRFLNTAAAETARLFDAEP